MLVRYEFLIILNLYANEASYQLHADMCGTLCFHNVTTTTIIRKDDAWPWTWVFRSSCEKLPKPVCFMLDDRRIDKLIFFFEQRQRDKDVIVGFSETKECCWKIQPSPELWRWDDFDFFRLVCSMKEKLFIVWCISVFRRRFVMVIYIDLYIHPSI